MLVNVRYNVILSVHIMIMLLNYILIEVKVCLDTC